MNSSQRFCQTMAYGRPDRVPFFEEGIRADVVAAWRDQGMPEGALRHPPFPTDLRQEMAPELLPQTWPVDRVGLAAFRRDLDPDDPDRLPAGWPDRVTARQDQGDTILLRVHRGLYQTLGVGDWRSFAGVNLLLKDDPRLVRDMLAIQADFAADLVDRILSAVSIDAAIFSEPISGNSGPLISPAMFAELADISYEPVLAVLRRFGVETIIIRTYANFRILLPDVVRRGFNCLWAAEVNQEAMDYHEIRRQYGRDLRLIGGIDVDVLRQDEATIRRELEKKVPPLLQDGGFIPLADGRVRAVVPYQNYVFYRTLLTDIVSRGPSSIT